MNSPSLAAARRTPPDVLGPGDLAAHHVGRRVQVGGRVLRGGATWLVGDALRVVRVAPRSLAVAGPAPGALVLVEATCSDAPAADAGPYLLSDAEVVWLGAGAPLATGEYARLAGGAAEALRQRARLIACVREHFDAAGFVEVETPTVVPSPGLDVHLAAFAVAAAEPRFLSTSPEYQMKRLLAGGLPRIYQLARAYRRNELGAWHNPEFTLLEWYRAFAGVEDVMRDTEQLVSAVAAAAGVADGLEIPGLGQVALAAPFERTTVADAFARYAGVGREELCHLAANDEDRYFRLLVERVEPALARLERPVFLCEYPASQASLARRKPGDPAFCERFELYLGGVELCNGFGELTDPAEQRARFSADQAERARRGQPVYPVDHRFVAALDEGLPPSAGNALGLDRLLALVLGKDRIGGVLAFPADWL